MGCKRKDNVNGIRQWNIQQIQLVLACMYNIMSVQCSLDYMNQINDEGCHPKKVILCKQQS